MTPKVVYNGNLISSNTPFLLPDNRSFRYGDGLFETMKIFQGKILWSDFHFDRLFSSLNILKFDLPVLFTREYFSKLILNLCQVNGVEKLARVRLTIFRADGGLYDPINHRPHFIIQAWDLPRHVLSLNENGLVIDIFPDARKSFDKLANIKSNNGLPYVMGAIYARENHLNEVILLNQFGRVADTTLANLFLVRGEQIITPPLSEGGVWGVMRRVVLSMESPFLIREKILTIKDLESADEIFLTNAIYGLRWVGRFRDTFFVNSKAVILHELLHEITL
ncbi:MAG: aminotransferase class IV [Chitinophagaceae bacterium]